MELTAYVQILRRRWMLIAFIVLVCVGSAAAATYLQTPQYRSSTRLLVSGSTRGNAIDEIAQRQLAVQRATAFAQIATTAPAVRAAQDRARQQAGPFSSSGSPSIQASADGISPFIVVTVTDPDAHRAQAVANAYAATLPVVVKQLDQVPTSVPEEVTTLEPAGLPTSPYSPKPVRNLLIGLALGVVLGLGLALGREALDRRLKSADDVERVSELTVLGVVPDELGRHLLPSRTHPSSGRAEAYRRIRTNLAFATGEGTPKSIVITSATSGEGKTSLATNLAIACSRTGQRVALVDADLRRPMVHRYLGVSAERGLTDVLTGSATLDEVVQYTEGGSVAVLASGPIPDNPSELLGSSRMVDVLRRLEADFDIVIVDTPPTLPVTDALLVAVNAAGVVLVTRVGDATRDRLLRARNAVTKVHATLVGVVPNAAEKREEIGYGYGYGYKGRDDVARLVTEPATEGDRTEPLRPASRESAALDGAVVNGKVVTASPHGALEDAYGFFARPTDSAHGE